MARLHGQGPSTGHAARRQTRRGSSGLSKSGWRIFPMGLRRRSGRRRDEMDAVSLEAPEARGGDVAVCRGTRRRRRARRRGARALNAARARRHLRRRSGYGRRRSASRVSRRALTSPCARPRRRRRARPCARRRRDERGAVLAAGGARSKRCLRARARRRRRARVEATARSASREGRHPPVRVGHVRPRRARLPRRAAFPTRPSGVPARAVNDTRGARRRRVRSPRPRARVGTDDHRGSTPTR